MRTWPIILAVAVVGNVAFAGLHIWEHDGKLALFSLGAATFCLIGLIGSLLSEDSW